MKYYGKAEEITERLIGMFSKGETPKALAQVFLRREGGVPMQKWSYMNRLCAWWACTDDARGAGQWRKVGRYPKKGSKAFYILAPCVAKDKDENGLETGKEFLYGFRGIPVFRREDTEGDALPEVAEAEKVLNSMPLLDVARAWGLETSVDFSAVGNGALGYYVPGKKIALGVANLSTWLHELVHAADDKLTHMAGDSAEREIVAELGGAALGIALGRDVEADAGGAWEYIQRQAGGDKSKAVASCMRLVKRVEACLDLIMAANETPVETEEIA